MTGHLVNLKGIIVFCIMMLTGWPMASSCMEIYAGLESGSWENLYEMKIETDKP